jgi:hypothetical protein
VDTLSPAQKWAPYAYSAGKQLGIDPAFVLAQWLYETGNGTNLGSTKYNNLAGLKNGSTLSSGEYDPADSIHAGYSSLSAFTSDYVRMMNQSNMKSFMSVATSGADISTVLSAFDASPYAVGNYNKSGFMNYYKQATKVVGNASANNYSTDAITDLLDGVNTDGILKILKDKWWIVAAALVLIAILK